jgi:hypothetical protein
MASHYIINKSDRSINFNYEEHFRTGRIYALMKYCDVLSYDIKLTRSRI